MDTQITLIRQANIEKTIIPALLISKINQESINYLQTEPTQNHAPTSETRFLIKRTSQT